MAEQVRHFEQTTRNWLTAGAVMACFAMAAIGQQAGAPWVWSALLAGVGILALASFLAERKGGWRISATEIYFHDGQSWDLRLAPERILWVSMHSNCEGPDVIRLHLRSGSVRELPDHCTGRRRELIDALRTNGIEVRDERG